MSDKKTILIVDDSPVVRMVLRAHLKDYNIIEASSKEDALAKYDQSKKGEIALIVTDCDMEKEMIGFDLISDIRRRGGKMPIIMLSGGQAEEKKARLALMGGDNLFMDKTETVAIVDKVAEKLAGTQLPPRS